MNRKVLIFDDDREIIELCNIILSRLGITVCCFTSCTEDTVNKVIELQPSAILLDNTIPYIGGVETAKRIKNNAATCFIPVILFTANSNIAKLAEEAKADYFLRKPFNIDELERQIMKAMDRYEQIWTHKLNV